MVKQQCNNGRGTKQEVGLNIIHLINLPVDCVCILDAPAGFDTNLDSASSRGICSTCNIN